MTQRIFESWLVDWDEALRKEDRKVLLLVDNFAGHVFDTAKVTNITVERFSPNLTSHVQPMDADIIMSFKAPLPKARLEKSPGSLSRTPYSRYV